jgi:DNA-binding MarR family transcriptional regulator
MVVAGYTIKNDLINQLQGQEDHRQQLLSLTKKRYALEKKMSIYQPNSIASVLKIAEPKASNGFYQALLNNWNNLQEFKRREEL